MGVAAIIAILLLGGFFALAGYRYITGTDPIEQLTEAVTGSMQKMVEALVMPIEIPMRFLSDAFYWIDTWGGPIALFAFVMLYRYLLVSLVVNARPNKYVVKMLIVIGILGALVYRIRFYVSHYAYDFVREVVSG